MTGNLMRLAVGMTSSSLSRYSSPVSRCLTAMATLLWCACASGASRQAVPAGLVVGARTLHGGVVLGDVEVGGPRPQGGGQRRQRLVERLGVGPVPILRQDAVLRGVGAERVEQRVSHIGLEAER